MKGCPDCEAREQSIADRLERQRVMDEAMEHLERRHFGNETYEALVQLGEAESILFAEAARQYAKEVDRKIMAHPEKEA